MGSDASNRPPAGQLPLDSLDRLGAALVNRPYARRGVGASSSPISVVLADDHTVIRQALRALLRGSGDVAVIGEADSGPAAVALVRQLSPDVVLMDLDMPGGGGAAATEAIAALERPAKVLILTMHDEDSHLLSMLERGARGFLTKDAAEGDLIDAIRVVASGDVYVRPSVARLLAAKVRVRSRPQPMAEVHAQFAKLSDRERAVLQLIAEGYNGPEVGQRLGITAKTVDTYKQRIEEKLGITHRTEYVRLASALGML